MTVFAAKDPNNFDLDQSVRRIQLTKKKVQPGKTAIVPSRIRHGFIHKPLETDVVKNFVHVRMNKSDAYFLHLGSAIEEFKVIFNKNKSF